MARVAINGFGRIGRAAFRQIVGSDLEVVAINDLAPAENLAYLLRYDSVYGSFEKPVSVDGTRLVIEGKRYPALAEKDPAQLPWRDLGVDLVFECTGRFNHREDLEKHLGAGARRAILSAPAKGEEIPTVVYGVNHQEHANAPMVSCASCTTNAIAPVVEILNRRVGVRKAALTTIHSYTSTQALVDGPNKKFRRGRAGAANFVPSSTGAAVATTLALPALRGKFDGFAVRAPIPAGSLADIVLVAQRQLTIEEINDVLTAESATDRYRGVVEVTRDPIVSSDVIRRSCASLVDLELTQIVDGDLVKVLVWYDNEWGYTSQMVRVGRYMVGASRQSG